MAKAESVRSVEGIQGRDPVVDGRAIRTELKRITESSSFRGSRRSKLFLEYVVNTALVGHFDELKERVIGSALFGRPVNYDTGADAIVRVVANETRRRLQAYQADTTSESLVRIELSAGSYLPVFHHSPQTNDREGADGPVMSASITTEPDASAPTSRRPAGFRWPWQAATLILAGVCLVLIAQDPTFRQGIVRSKPADSGAVQPWSALFIGNRGLQVILADTSVGVVQNFLNRQLPLGGYLDREFIPREAKVDPKLDRFLNLLLATESTSSGYATTAVRIAQFGQVHGVPVGVTFARSMTLRTIKSGGNFVILGTTRANPWAQLFDSQLNFGVEYNPETGEPSLRNRAPRPGEDSLYTPSLGASPTVLQSYGHIAFMPALFKGGHFLLVTGTSSAATEAAGEFLTNEDRMRSVLSNLGADPYGEPRSFEILLRVKGISGAPIQFEVVTGRLAPAEKTGGLSRPSPPWPN
jgi:hypothetical protein